MGLIAKLLRAECVCTNNQWVIQLRCYILIYRLHYIPTPFEIKHRTIVHTTALKSHIWSGESNNQYMFFLFIPREAVLEIATLLLAPINMNYCFTLPTGALLSNLNKKWQLLNLEWNACMQTCELFLRFRSKLLFCHGILLERQKKYLTICLVRRFHEIDHLVEIHAKWVLICYIFLYSCTICVRILAFG